MFNFILLVDVIPVCNFSCGNGICVADNLCQCFERWTGDQCDEGMDISCITVTVLF